MRTYLNIKCPRGEQPYFWDYQEQTKLQNVQGKFKAVTFKDKEFTYQGKDIKYREMQLILEAKDGTELYVCNALNRGITRTLLNSLISKPEHGTLRIGLYNNKSGFASVSVTAIAESGQDDFLNWHLSWEDQQEYIKTTDLPDGTKNRFYGDLEKHLEQEALKLKPIEQEKASPMDVSNDKRFGEDDTDEDLLPF